jgi:hypothetical protein
MFKNKLFTITAISLLSFNSFAATTNQDLNVSANIEQACIIKFENINFGNLELKIDLATTDGTINGLFMLDKPMTHTRRCSKGANLIYSFSSENQEGNVFRMKGQNHGEMMTYNLNHIVGSSSFNLGSSAASLNETATGELESKNLKGVIFFPNTNGKLYLPKEDSYLDTVNVSVTF